MSNLISTTPKKRRKIIFNNIAYFTEISSEIIKLILSYVAIDNGKIVPKHLFRCSLVCKDWNQICFEIFLPIFNQLSGGSDDEVETAAQTFVGITLFWKTQERVSFLFGNDIKTETLNQIAASFSMILNPEEGARLIQMCLKRASEISFISDSNGLKRSEIPEIMLKNYLLFKSLKDDTLARFWDSLLHFDSIQKINTTSGEEDEFLHISDRMIQLIAKTVDNFVKFPNKPMKWLSPLFSFWEVEDIAAFCSKLLLQCSFDKKPSGEELGQFYLGVISEFESSRAAKLMAKVTEDMSIDDSVNLIFSMKMVPLIADAQFLYSSIVPDTQIESIAQFLNDYCSYFSNVTIRVQFMNIFCEKLEPYLLRLSTLISKEQLCKILLKFVVVGWRNI